MQIPWVTGALNKLATSQAKAKASQALEQFETITGDRTSTRDRIRDAAALVAQQDPNLLEEMTPNKRLGIEIMAAKGDAQIELIAKTLEENSSPDVSAALSNLGISQRSDFDTLFNPVRELLKMAQGFSFDQAAEIRRQIKLQQTRTVQSLSDLISKNFETLGIKAPDDLLSSAQNFINTPDDETRKNLVGKLESTIKQFDVAANRETVKEELKNKYGVGRRVMPEIIIPAQEIYRRKRHVRV